jgi:murein DD-endopeptidase MepM/ murein hydrolase activator NlpD
VYGKPAAAGAAAVCGILVFSTLITSDFTYYEYSYKGKVLGVVKSEAEVYRTVARPEVLEAISEKAGASVVLDDEDNIEMKKVIKLAPAAAPVDGEDDIISNIAALDDVNVVGQAILCGGEEIGAVASAEEADRLLRLVKARWLGEEPASGGAGSLSASGTASGEAGSLPASGSAFSEADSPSASDSAFSEAGSASTSGIASGPAFSEADAPGGADSATADFAAAGFAEAGFIDEVTLNEVKTKRKNIETADEIFTRLAQTSFSAIGFRTVERVTYEEEYSEEPVYEIDEDRYEDYEVEITPGASGRRVVTADFIRVNGELEEKKVALYEVLQPAVAAHSVKGAKKLPDPVGSGMFVFPSRGGAISSPFGPRWGRMHQGLDIDINYAPVYAAGDGKVVYTGNKGDGYGIMILIDHGDGFQTLYAHLSQSSVSAGDEVYKGQRIATSGNTGRSTGAHLHFEVRVGGTPRNPLGYL